MGVSKKPSVSSKVPKEARDRASKLISQIFDLLGQQLGRLGKDLEEFNKKRTETRRRIDEGARRTSGRIV